MQSLGAPDWPSALDDPGDAVVVAGGDGTVAAIASHMIGRPEPIAVIPMGTANNVARALGVRGTPEALMAAWPSWESVGFDVGRVTDGARTATFLECVGVGEFGRLIADSDLLERASREDDRERKLERDLAHLRDRVAASDGQGIALTIDGVDRSGEYGVDRSGEYVLAEVVNVWTIGPRLGLAPAAAVDDGRLHVVLVDRDHRPGLVRYLESLRRGEIAAPEIEVIAASRVELGCSVHDLHVDGELWCGDSSLIEAHHRVELVLSVMPSAVHFLRPPRAVQPSLPIEPGDPSAPSAHVGPERLTSAPGAVVSTSEPSSPGRGT